MAETAPKAPALFHALTHSDVRGRLMRHWGRQVWLGIDGVWRRSVFYRMSLRGKHSDLIVARPVDPWPGDPETADEMFKGHYNLGGFERQTPGVMPWREITDPQTGAVTSPLPQLYLEEFHGFAWLRHFQAADDLSNAGPVQRSAARNYCHNLVHEWLDDYAEHYDPIAWAPEVTARRLISWASHLNLLAELAEPVYRSALMSAMWKHARHLRRTIHRAPHGRARITCALGLIYSGLLFERDTGRIKRGLELLAHELGHQILADGAHETASPHETALVLADLVGLVRSLDAARMAVPHTVTLAIDRVVPFVRMSIMGDGGMAQMNGGRVHGIGPQHSIARSYAEPFATPQEIVKATGVRARALMLAPHAGYARADAHRTTLLVDASQPDRLRESNDGAGGTGSFELSAGKQRLIVNCGPPFGLGIEWHNALRGTSAHSALCVGGHGHTSFYSPSNAVGQALGPIAADAPKAVELDRHDEDGDCLISVSHDGYHSQGLAYERSLYLSRNGNDIRGEDRLTSLQGRAGRKAEGQLVEIRFHVHPNVAASPSGRQDMILLNPPSGPGWSFNVRGADFALEESIYAALPGTPRKAKQIVLRARTNEGGLTVNWALKRFDPPAKKTDDEED